MPVRRLAQLACRRHRPARTRVGRSTGGLVAALLAAACSPSADDPEAAIEALVSTAVRAAETGNDRTIERLLAGDYEDAEGRGRREAMLYLRMLLRRYPRPVISVRGLQIELLSPALARVDLNLVALGRADGTSPRVDLDATRLQLRLALRRDGDEWRVTRADRLR
jgi:hypothetical protein